MSLSIFSENPRLFLLGVSLLGMLIGSFLNVVIIRLPKRLQDTSSNPSHPPYFNLLYPASHCPKCQKPIRWFHNIPVLSYLWLKGRCFYCQKIISLRYPFVEILAGLLSLIVAYHFGPTWMTVAGLTLTWVLIALAFIDLDHTILPDDITLPFLWIGLLFNAFEIFTPPSSAIWGAIGGYLLLWIICWIFYLLTKKVGMGEGDFKLLAMLGAWLGWQSLFLIILISSLLGSVIGLGLIFLGGRDKNLPIPFGPFLAIGGFCTLLLLPKLHYLYFNLLTL